MDTNSPEKKELSVVFVLQDIKNGILDPRLIDKTVRKGIVALLRSEGYTVSAISQILKCSDKTVQRIVTEIRKDWQVAPSSDFVKETVGDMFRAASSHWSSLMRLARNPSSTTREKIEAETAAWGVLRDYVEQLRRIGYLPSATQEVVGKFVHQLNDGEEKSWQEMRSEVVQLAMIAKETAVMTPELEVELLELTQKIDKSAVEEKIQTIINKENLPKEDISHEQEQH